MCEDVHVYVCRNTNKLPLRGMFEEAVHTRMNWSAVSYFVRDCDWWLFESGSAQLCDDSLTSVFALTLSDSEYFIDPRGEIL